MASLTAAPNSQDEDCLFIRSQEGKINKQRKSEKGHICY